MEYQILLHVITAATPGADKSVIPYTSLNLCFCFPYNYAVRDISIHSSRFASYKWDGSTLGKRRNMTRKKKKKET